MALSYHDRGYSRGSGGSGAGGDDWNPRGSGGDRDLVVDNLPYATFMGQDTQLQTAIEYLKQKIKDEPVEVPKAPKHPDKAFREN